jgi:hypothetical protein
VNKKNDKTFRTSIFRVMETVYRLIIYGGRHSGGAEAQQKPQERDNYVLGDNFQRILRKNEGLK